MSDPSILLRAISPLVTRPRCGDVRRNLPTIRRRFGPPVGTKVYLEKREIERKWTKVSCS